MKRETYGYKFSLLGSHGGHSPSGDIGDLQIVSNIDTEGVEAIRFYEVYVTRYFDNFELSAGWMDLSLRYNVTDPALLFIGSSFGTTAEWGATGFRGPSIYPVLSFGLHSWWQSSGLLYAGVSVVDPLTPENFYPKQLQTHVLLNTQNHMAVGEIGLKREGRFQVALGVTNMTMERRGSRPEFQQSGGYIMSHFTGPKGFSPFFRFGEAVDRPGYMYRNLVLGVSKEGFLAGEKIDRFGLGYSMAAIGSVTTPEEVYEAIYSLDILKNFTVALSSQWITNPSGQFKDGQVTTLRFQITLF